MEQKQLETERGRVTYWLSKQWDAARQTLVFLPGLTAEHELFAPQLRHFAGRYNLFVWDAPAHGASRPYAMDFTMEEVTRVLHGILQKEGITRPVMIGQSYGGYLAQMFAGLYPGTLAGAAAVDSAPLQRSYYTAAELWCLKNWEPLARCWPDLKGATVKGTAVTPKGRAYMARAVGFYTTREFRQLAGQGYRGLCAAIAADRPYALDCPALLICGTEDAAGYVKKYNRAWSKRAGLPLVWVENAGHNANTDQPEAVNRALDGFLEGLRRV